MKRLCALVLFVAVFGYCAASEPIKTPSVSKRCVLKAPAGKSIYIDLAKQWLYCVQDGVIVMNFRVCTGKPGHRTPKGNFYIICHKRIGRAKKEYGYVKLPYFMPFHGDSAIHGFSKVPRTPSSHSCVRMHERNARKVYYWAKNRTRVRVRKHVHYYLVSQAPRGAFRMPRSTGAPKSVYNGLCY